MSRNGFRFVHATGLCLDEPLRGTGPLSGEDLRLAEEATFLSWQGIVETCLNSRADFLLLTGNSFDSRTESLRARVALIDGFEQLAAHGVDAFVVPGALDPMSAWTGLSPRGNGAHLRSNGPFDHRATSSTGGPNETCARSVVPAAPRPLAGSLPPNVTLIADEQHEPIAVIREDRLIASVFAVAASALNGPAERGKGAATFQTHRAPYRIGVVSAGALSSPEYGPAGDGGDFPMASHPRVQAALGEDVEYLAWGDGIVRTDRRSRTVMHDPGFAQPLWSVFGGPHGCSVVDVSPEGETRIERVVTAPVRRERIQIKAERHATWSDLADRMAPAIIDHTPDPAERLWLIEWNVTGTGIVHDLLSETAAQVRLWKRLETDLGEESHVRRVHRLISEPEVERPVTSSGIGLLDDFDALMDEWNLQEMQRLQHEMLDAATDASHGQLLEFLRQVPASRTRARSHLLAAGWLE